jgi:hypothetical protein
MYYNPARLPVKFGCIGSSLSSKIIYLKTNLKTDVLHCVGDFFKFLKKGPKNFPTYEGI